MRRFLTSTCLALLAVAMAATAAAEKTVAVNDPAVPGVFDQPAATASGSVVHVAYIGADTAAGPFRLYYAAINGGSDFTNLSLSRTTAGFLVTPPTVVGSTAPGNDAYVDARHPRIAVRSATEAVILFQAKTAASPDPAYSLYMARLTLQGGAVVNQSVRIVTGLGGFTEDVSFALVSSDNTARIAYAGRPGITGGFDVYYARVSLETAAVTGSPGTPLLLSSVAGSSGSRPLPSLRLDSSRQVHIAWAANGDTAPANGIYYAMVEESNGADTVAIAATEVIGRSRRWGHPNLLVDTTRSLFILAADETLPEISGSIGLVNIDPGADDQDGSPVQVRENTRFLLTQPGELILSDSFSVYRPEAFLDVLEQIHVTGYGTGGTRATYYAFKLSRSFPYAQLVKAPSPVGLDSSEFPASLTGDYTRAAFGFLTGGKVVVFWSGEVAGTGSRNLDVTALPTVSAISSDESGCTAVSGPGREKAVRIPDILLLVFPIVVLGIRRARKATIR